MNIKPISLLTTVLAFSSLAHAEEEKFISVYDVQLKVTYLKKEAGKGSEIFNDKKFKTDRYVSKTKTIKGILLKNKNMKQSNFFGFTSFVATENKKHTARGAYFEPAYKSYNNEKDYQQHDYTNKSKTTIKFDKKFVYSWDFDPTIGSHGAFKVWLNESDWNNHHFSTVLLTDASSASQEKSKQSVQTFDFSIFSNDENAKGFLTHVSGILQGKTTENWSYSYKKGKEKYKSSLTLSAKGTASDEASSYSINLKYNKKLTQKMREAFINAAGFDSEVDYIFAKSLTDKQIAQGTKAAEKEFNLEVDKRSKTRDAIYTFDELKALSPTKTNNPN